MVLSEKGLNGSVFNLFKIPFRNLFGDTESNYKKAHDN
jgi:hypothetical protein